MANVIDLTNDVVINQGDLEAPAYPYKPSPADVVGVDSSTLTVNHVQLTINSISDVAPGTDLTLIVNQAAHITFGQPEIGQDFYYESSEKLASLSAHITSQISGVHLHQNLVENVEGETSVTFEGDQYQTFTYTIGREPSAEPIEIQVYGMGKHSHIQSGNLTRDDIGSPTISYESETSVLTISFERPNLAFNVHDVSASDAQIMMEHTSRYIAAVERDDTLLIKIPEGGPVCFLRGTLVSTERGPVAVESLEVGDKLPCLNGSKTIKWVGRRSDRISDLRSVDLAQYLPIRIRAGAISHMVPCKDLAVSPGHHVMISGYLVRAGDLVNGTTITQFSPNELERIDYFHIELDQFDMIDAHGVHSESWADGGNRSFFQNADVTTLRPTDARRRRAPRPGFDHLVLRKGNKLKTIQARIAKRATLFLSESELAVKIA